MIKYLLRKAGYRVVRLNSEPDPGIIDLQEVTADPVEAVYRAGSSQTSEKNSWVVIRVPMRLLRSYLMSFGEESPHPDPFVDTVSYCLSSRSGEAEFEGSPLEEYFKEWQPKNAAELLGISMDKKVNPILLSVPPYGLVYPWDSDSPFDRAHETRPENGGWQHCGPVSKEKGAQEFERYAATAHSIEKNGYTRDPRRLDGDIAGLFLFRDGEFRVSVCDGVHRFAVLRALHYRDVPVCLRRWPMIVRRADFRSWPNVANGLFDPGLALNIFDRVFDAEQPIEYSKSIKK